MAILPHPKADFITTGRAHTNCQQILDLGFHNNSSDDRVIWFFIPSVNETQKGNCQFIADGWMISNIETIWNSTLGRARRIHRDAFFNPRVASRGISLARSLTVIEEPLTGFPHYEHSENLSRSICIHFLRTPASMCHDKRLKQVKEIPECLYKHNPDNPMGKSTICEPMDLCLCTYFTFYGEIYEQIMVSSIFAFLAQAVTQAAKDS